MSDTDGLRGYSPRAYPTIKGGEGVFVNDELKKISVVLRQIITACKALDERITTLENA